MKNHTPARALGFLIILIALTACKAEKPSPEDTKAAQSCPLDKAIYAPYNGLDWKLDTENLIGLSMTRLEDDSLGLLLTSYSANSEPLISLSYRAACDINGCGITIPRAKNEYLTTGGNSIRGFNHDLSFVPLEKGHAPEYIVSGYYTGRFYGGYRYPHGDEAKRYEGRAKVHGDNQFQVGLLPNIGITKLWQRIECNGHREQTPEFSFPTDACADPYFIPHPAYQNTHTDLHFEFIPGATHRNPNSIFKAYTEPKHRLVSLMKTSDGFTNGSGELYIGPMRFTGIGNGPQAYVLFGTEKLLEMMQDEDWGDPDKAPPEYKHGFTVKFLTDDHVLPDFSGINVWVYGGCLDKEEP